MFPPESHWRLLLADLSSDLPARSEPHRHQELQGSWRDESGAVPPGLTSHSVLLGARRCSQEGAGDWGLVSSVSASCPRVVDKILHKLSAPYAKFECVDLALRKVPIIIYIIIYM